MTDPRLRRFPAGRERDGRLEWARYRIGAVASTISASDNDEKLEHFQLISSQQLLLKLLAITRSLLRNHPMRVGIHFCHRYRPEFILGPGN
jgi:hypothetical protein